MRAACNHHEPIVTLQLSLPSCLTCTCRLLTRVTIPENFPHCNICSASNEFPRRVLPKNGTGLRHRGTCSPIVSASGVKGVVGVPAGDGATLTIGTGSDTRGVISGSAHSNVQRFFTILSFGQGVRSLHRPKSCAR